MLLTDAAYEGGRLRFTEVPLSYSDGVLSGSSRTVTNFVVVVLQQLVVTGTGVTVSCVLCGFRYVRLWIVEVHKTNCKLY